MHTSCVHEEKRNELSCLYVHHVRNGTHPRSVARCPICSERAHGECVRSTRCNNYNGEHRSTYKECLDNAIKIWGLLWHLIIVPILRQKELPMEERRYQQIVAIDTSPKDWPDLSKSYAGVVESDEKRSTLALSSWGLGLLRLDPTWGEPDIWLNIVRPKKVQ